MNKFNQQLRDIVVTETLEDIDKDADGKTNVDEYIGDMHREGSALAVATWDSWQL